MRYFKLKENNVDFPEHREGINYREDYRPSISHLTVSELVKWRPECWEEVFIKKDPDEEAFINQCAIEAMSGFISGAKQFHDIRSPKDICEASWNLAERMNEERKKRLKS